MATLTLSLESTPEEYFHRKMIAVEEVDGELDLKKIARTAHRFLETVRHETRPRWFHRTPRIRPHTCSVTLAADMPRLNLSAGTRVLFVKHDEKKAMYVYKLASTQSTRVEYLRERS